MESTIHSNIWIWLKQDQDDTDFRKLAAVASERCVFYSDIRPELENDLAFVIASPEPVVEGHSLVIPKRHFVGIILR